MATVGVRLTWSLSTDQNVSGYNVYYGTGSRNYDQKLAIGNTNGVDVSGLREGFTYYFAVTANDSWGRESDFSSEVSYSVPAPDSMVLYASAGNEPQSIDLIWNPSTVAGADAYYVYYGTESGVYNLYAAYADTESVLYGFPSGVTNYFVVSAVDVNGTEIDRSSEASYVIPVPEPIVLQAGGGPVPQSVALAWNPGSNGDYYAYNVYYGTTSGTYDYSETFYGVNDAVIYGLTGGATNYFTVSGITSFGFESERSAESSCYVPVPEPVKLQTQTLLDENGVPYYLIINAAGAVAGWWELDSSTDLQNWSYYSSGYGYGYGEDVNVYVWMDPSVPVMYFRLQRF